MTEIVRMTSQMHPLEMGVPLYPFSHSGVFPINKDESIAGIASAPLPDSSSLEDNASASPASLRGLADTPPMGVAMPGTRQGDHIVDVMSWRTRPSASASPESSHARTYIPNISQHHSQQHSQYQS